MLRTRSLRRLQYAVLGSMLGRMSFIVAGAVWAYEAGGVELVGLAGFLRMAPGAFVAPFAATLADRYPRQRVMAVSDGGRALLTLVIAAVIAADAPPAVVLALLAVISVLTSVFEPARAAILPSLVDRPELLAASNAVSSAVNSAAYFLGPALGAFLLAVSSVEATIALTALPLVWSGIFALTLRPYGDGAPAAAADATEPGGWLDAVREGVKVVREDPGLLLIVGLFGVQTLIAGALSVLVVVVALDLLEAGTAWVGILDAAAGVGALIGVAFVTRLTSRRLSTGVIVGLTLWGLPLLLIALVDLRVAAIAAMLLIGIGDTAIDVSSYTLVQRIVPETLLGRVFGLVETVAISGLAVGALIAPFVVELLGIEGALIAFACLPVTILFAVSALRRLDARAVVDERPRVLLRGLPMFSVLPLPVLDSLAMAARPLEVADGTAVVSQGDRGDRYYVVDEGELDVLVDGAVITRISSGEGFGELALLRDAPRAASVVARGPVRVFALDREAFLNAVTAHAGSTRAANAVMAAYRPRSAAAPA
ncbi:MAG TPA: MFS transporter [Solirubrobacteraceae bacterium]|nr:MFS transporter [Solirubrobacteraceae bacterium]